MKERPILFSGPMVRALLDGRKTQTRRVVKGLVFTPDAARAVDDERGGWHFTRGRAVQVQRVHCPHGGPGDVLWVRETLRYDWAAECWRFDATGDRLDVLFGRDLERPRPDRWPTGVCVSIHMPRWASRIGLRITDVLVERLNYISEADALAEGMTFPEGLAYGNDPKDAFAGLWRSINGPESWAANPWVWAVSFEALS